MSEEDDKNKHRWMISYNQIGLIIFTLLLGIVLGLLVTNTQTGSPSSFTTTELIGFVLSVILSGASIVLAITAIALGKSSELSIMRRSDESIRLQNEVFIRTTDALQRIESSTGVTEKRIEDIISGRVGDISQQIAEMATGGGKYQVRDPRELEENIRKSLIKTLREERGGSVNDEERLEKRKKLEEERDKYQVAHEQALYVIANMEGVDIEKVGHGNLSLSGRELFDGLYSKNDKKFAVSTFVSKTPIGILTEFAGKAASEIAKGYVNSVYMIVFHPEDKDEIEKEVKEHLSTLKDELANNIIIAFSDYDNIDKSLSKINL